MNILYIVNALADKNNPAKEPFVKAQIDSVRRAGVNVSIYNINGNESKFNYIKAIFNIRKLLKTEQIDIIHGHYVYSGWIAALQSKTISVVSFMGSDLNGSPKNENKLQLRGYIDIILCRLLEFLVTGTIVKSEKMQQRLGKKNKSIALPNGVDFNYFKPINRNDARRLLSLDLKKKYILFAGNYKIPRKAFGIVKQAVRMLHGKNESIEILLAYGLPHKQIPLFMNAANVLTLPSISEGSPNVIKEAMACNLPIVSTDVGDVRDIISDVEGCMIVDRTPDAFAGAIQKILSTVDRTNGREAINSLRIEKIAVRLIQFYKTLLHQKKSCIL